MTNITQGLVKWDALPASVFCEFSMLSRFSGVFKKLNDSISKTYGAPDYYIADLAKTAPENKNSSSRCYKEALKPVENQRGLYIFWSKDSQNDMFYVGKTGKEEKTQKGCDVFYKSSGGSGRIPHHIVGGEKVLFKEAFEQRGSSASNWESYHNFINGFYVLCIVIGNNQNIEILNQHLSLWEKYLILSLLPSHNKEVRLKVSDFKFNDNNQPCLCDFEDWLP